MPSRSAAFARKAAFPQVIEGNQVRVEDLVQSVPDVATGTRPIRVCMVCGPGGAELDGVGDYVERLIGALADVGVRATAVPVRPRGGPASPGWWPAAWRAARRVRRMRPDLVHVQFAPSAYRFSGVPGMLPLLLRTSAPLVVTVHEYGSWSTLPWLPQAVWRLMERAGLCDRETGRLVPSASAVIVTNPGHAGEVRARTGRVAVEVPLAANVTDHGATPEDRRRIRAELGLAAEDPLLAFFGFVHPVKGIRHLLEALAMLRARRPGTRLLVIGGFTSQALPEHEARAFRAELDRLAHRYGVADAVTFTGYLPAPAASRMLHAADVAVLPYTAGVTAKSGALLTVLAHGLPTAVTVPERSAGGRAEEHRGPGGPDRGAVPGCVEVIGARRDAAAIAHAVERLAADPELRRRLAAAGRRYAARHSWPRVAAAHRDLYAGLVGRRGG